MFFNNKLMSFWQVITREEKELFFAAMGALACLWAVFSFQREIVMATLLIVGFCLLQEKIWSNKKN